MGSLMAGWNSHAHHDPKAAIYKRNKSLTKGEIEAYWRSKKRIEEDHLKAILLSSTETQDTTPKRTKEATLQRTSTFPMTERSRHLLKTELPGLEDLTKKKGWWTRSCWAFLNEPLPVIVDELSNSQAC